MARKPRKCTKEFSPEAVRLMEKNGKVIAQKARNLDVNDNVLHRGRMCMDNRNG